MIPETSYNENGRLQHNADLTRGHWAKPSDFILAGISLAFRLDVLTFAWIMFPAECCGFIVFYLICLFFLIVPLFIIQSFLGQFISSGFITAFRVSPLFKGIGYISVALNFIILTYYSYFAAIPLLLLFHSVRPTLPWSCEGMKSWSNDYLDPRIRHACHLLSDNDTMTKFDSERHEVPSNLFFRAHFGYFSGNTEALLVPWEVLLCTFVVWTFIAAIFYKWHEIEKLSRFLRYSISIAFILLIVTIIRFSMLPKDPWMFFYKFFLPSNEFKYILSIANLIVYTFITLGVGWGIVIALASFNKFKTNIITNSWIICFGQMLVFLSFALITLVTDNYFQDISKEYNEKSIKYAFFSNSGSLIFCTGSVMADMAWPNLWCLIYFTLIFLAAIITMTITLLSTLQSFFDEFERFRSRKMEVTFIVIGLLTISSIYTWTKNGYLFQELLIGESVIIQTLLNVLFLLVILWVYGRIRFQRDIEFMLKRRFATWKIYMLRFVSIICLFLILLTVFLVLFFILRNGFIGQIIDLLSIIATLTYLSGYMIYMVLQARGTFITRLKCCCRPHNWYPLELEDRQQYESMRHQVDMSHQYTEMYEETAT